MQSVKCLNTSTHTNLRMLHLDTSNSVILQIHFHTLLLQAIIGEWLYIATCLNVDLIVFIHRIPCPCLPWLFSYQNCPISQQVSQFTCYLVHTCTHTHTHTHTHAHTHTHTTTRCSLHDVYRTLVISSCGRLSGLGAMVWTGDFYLWIPWLLVVPAQLQSFRGTSELVMDVPV